MADTFTCPSCGAPITYDGAGATTRCPFCSQSIIVPDTIRTAGGDDLNPGTAFPHESDPMAEVIATLHAGKKIEAIKQYRQMSGLGLKESKAAIEAIEAGQAARVGEHTTSARGSSGGTSVLGIIVAIFLLVFVLTGVAVVAWAEDRANQVPTQDTADERQALATASATRQPSPTPSVLSLVQTIGSSGVGEGQFDDVRSVAVDGEGNLYVVPYTGGRVQRFTPDGTFASQWMVDANFPVRAMTATRQGEILIVQHGTITRYNGLTGDVLGTLGTPNAGYEAIAPTLDGGVIAIRTGDFDDTLERFDAAGQSTLTVPSIVSSQSEQPLLGAAVAVDGQDHLYIASRRDEAVFHFTADGRFVNRFGSRGDAPGQFSALSGIGVDGQGRIYVTDIKGMHQFAPDGRYLGMIDLATPGNHIVITDDNTLWVAGRNHVYKLVPTP